MVYNSVTIWRYRWLACAIVVGIVSVLMVYGRWTEWVIHTRQVAILTVIRGVGSLSWCFVESRRVLFMCDYVICESSGE